MNGITSGDMFGGRRTGEELEMIENGKSNLVISIDISLGKY